MIEISATDNPAEAGWGKRKAKPRKQFADIFTEASSKTARDTSWIMGGNRSRR